MRTRSLIAAGMLMAFSAPAFAFHCPADIQAIKNAIPKSDLSEEKKAELKAAVDKGAILHKQGKHRQSTDVLSEAMRILLNGM